MSPKKNKLSRAQARSRIRRGKRRQSSIGWTVATGAIIAIGVVGIFLTFRGNTDTGSASGPQIGDHWHGYLGVNVCGSWLAAAPAYESPNGIHSHGDGLLHIHPTSSAAAGDNATVARFFEDNEDADWNLSADSMRLWDGVEYRNGQECVDGPYAGQKAVIQWAVSPVGSPWDDKPRRSNPADYHPKNGDIVAVAFIPKGEPIPEPPDAEAGLASIADLGGEGAVPTTIPTAPGSAGSPTETPAPGTEPVPGAPPPAPAPSAP